MYKRCRWSAKNHGRCEESSGRTVIESMVCAAKMSLASPALLCSTPAMDSSVLVLRTRYRTAVRAVRVGGEAKVGCQWKEWNSRSSCSVTCGEGQYNRLGFERGHWIRACLSQEVKCSKMAKRQRHHSWSTSVRGHNTSDYIGKGVTDTGCSRFLIGQNTLDKWEQMLAKNGT